jgi:hypothetical protein
MSFRFGVKEPDSFHFPRVEKKAVPAAFDGGQITSDGGVLLLAAVERLARFLLCPRRTVAAPVNKTG